MKRLALAAIFASLFMFGCTRQAKVNVVAPCKCGCHCVKCECANGKPCGNLKCNCAKKSVQRSRGY